MTSLTDLLTKAAAFEIDALDMLDVTCKAFPMSFHKRERKDAEFVYKRAFAAAKIRQAPILSALAAVAVQLDRWQTAWASQDTSDAEPARRAMFEALAALRKVCGDE